MSEQTAPAEQWRLGVIEVVNWGTFCGHHIIPVDRRGTLITGKSGSGKSTLLDAIATVLTPPSKRRYNAAAKTESSSREDRSLVSYIRGAFGHEATGTGEIVSRHLREKAVWSGVLLRYEHDAKEDSAYFEPVNLIALFQLKSGSVSGADISSAYAVTRGHTSLLDFRENIERGLDFPSLKRQVGAKGKVSKNFSSYATYFCRLLGIASPQTLELLHKTQAAKNFGSLDELFRRFMLEEPRTFELAEAAIEQFTSLSHAYAGVVDQRRQKDTLEPLENWKRALTTANKQLDTHKRLDKLLDPFTRHLELGIAEAQLERLIQHAYQLETERIERKAELDRAIVERQRAQALYDKNNGLALSQAENDALTAQMKLDDVERNQRQLENDLSVVPDVSLPTTRNEFEAMRKHIASIAEKAREDFDSIAQADTNAASDIVKAKEQIESIERELQHLRRKPTNIPAEYHRVRQQIARSMGINDADLPFFGELLDVAPSESEWHGALERLIGRQSLVMLVPENAIRAARTWINNNHLGLRLEFESIPAQIEVPVVSLSPRSSARKLVVADATAHPEFAQWVNRQLRRQFNYECVDTPDEMAHHQYSLTREGLIKRGNRHVKDDKRHLNDKSRWLLGTTNDAKIATLSDQLHNLQEAEIAAAKQKATTQRLIQQVAVIARLSASLEGAVWESYDRITATDDLARANKQIDLLKKRSSKLAETRCLLEHATTQEQEGRRSLAETESALANAIRERENCKHNKQVIQEGLSGSCTFEEADRLGLERLFSDTGLAYLDDAAILWKASSAVKSTLAGSCSKAQADKYQALKEIESIQTEFKRSWPSQSADLGLGGGEIDGYLDILHRIKAIGLPDYENKFLEVLTDFSRDRITALSSAIRNAFADIREKLNPVNKSLSLSEYASGIYLNIIVQKSLPNQAKDFLADLRNIVEGSWDAEDITAAEEKYTALESLIGRLSSSEYADRTWRTQCLDTRLHVTFIAQEITPEGNVRNVHANDAGLSGGEKQKLVIFCLAAALRYQLALEESATPSYGTVVLDEAFDKADPYFAKMAMGIFETFGFHMVLATPVKLLKTLENYVGSFVYVNKNEDSRSNISVLAFEDDSVKEAIDAER